mmetsp:Transcript_105788/g.178711  ORF Transcript_105788/g.178711 Transcript_105788/m.178711 type:complete len:218 (+) Transcript_105788:383-1036(+)
MRLLRMQSLPNTRLSTIDIRSPDRLCTTARHPLRQDWVQFWPCTHRQRLPCSPEIYRGSITHPRPSPCPRYPATPLQQVTFHHLTMGWPLDRTVDSSTTQNFCARSVRPNTPAARPIDEGLGLGLGLGTLKCWGAAPSSKMKYHLPLKTLSIIQKAGCKRWWEQQVSSYMLQNSPACLNFRPNHGYGTHTWCLWGCRCTHDHSDCPQKPQPGPYCGL